MRKPKPLPVPAEGGSYVVDKKGELQRREHTAGPLDPDHEGKQTARPAPTPPVKEN